MLRRPLLALAAALPFVLSAMSSTSAQTADAYPSRPIRIVQIFAAGGLADVVARIIGQKVSADLGQQIIVDAKPGAAGNIAAEHVARSPADGYTLLLGTISTHAINQNLYPKLAFDPLKDFAPIVLVSENPLYLVVSPDMPARNLGEFIAHAKANPGKLSYASLGSGSIAHLATELLKLQTGIDMLHVPYKGSAQSLPDLAASQVNFAFDGTALGQIKAGRIKALAIATSARWPAIPELPTAAETIPGFVASGWFGLMAPAGTSDAIVAKLNRTFNAALKDPEVTTRLLDSGVRPIGGTPDELRRFVVSETEKWGRAVKISGARIDQ